MRLDNEAWPAILFADPTAMKRTRCVCAPVAQYVRNVIARRQAGNDAIESREAALARGHQNYSAAKPLPAQ